MTLEVIGVSGDAVDSPLLADEERDGLLVVGDVGRVAAGARAGVVKGVL